MKHQVHALEGALLDAAVAMVEGLKFQIRDGYVFADWTPGAPPLTVSAYRPSSDWLCGGPIIERERIGLHRESDGFWLAGALHAWNSGGDLSIEAHYGAYGPTPLIAAMRAHVYAKLGGEVELPGDM